MTHKQKEDERAFSNAQIAVQQQRFLHNENTPATKNDIERLTILLNKILEKIK